MRVMTSGGVAEVCRSGANHFPSVPAKPTNSGQRLASRSQPEVAAGCHLECLHGPTSLELDPERRSECLTRGADSGDAVGAIATQLPLIVDNEQDDVAFARASEGIRGDASSPPASVLGPVVDVDLQPIRACVSNDYVMTGSSLKCFQARIPRESEPEIRSGGRI
jgi:hypothetical protein